MEFGSSGTKSHWLEGFAMEEKGFGQSEVKLVKAKRNISQGQGRILKIGCRGGQRRSTTVIGPGCF
jgi:hypothetical protein